MKTFAAIPWRGFRDRRASRVEIKLEEQIGGARHLEHRVRRNLLPVRFGAQQTLVTVDLETAVLV